MFILFNIFNIILNKNKVKFTNNIPPIILGRTGNRFKQIASLFERENLLLNQTRISIPDTPERNESINTTTFVADTPPGRDVDFSISTDFNNNNPITDATVTITSLIQDHINRHTQNSIANPEDQQNPQDIQPDNPQNNSNPTYIQTDNPQDHTNPPDIQSNNLQDLVNQPVLQSIILQDMVNPTTNNPQIQLNINQEQTNINQEQNQIQINIVQEQSEIQQEQNNQSKIKSKISVKFIPDHGAQTSKSTNNPVKRPNTFCQPTPKHHKQNITSDSNQNQPIAKKMQSNAKKIQPNLKKIQPNQKKIQPKRTQSKSNQPVRDESPSAKERNKNNGLKILTAADLPINPETHFIIEDFSDLIQKDDRENPTIIEELFDEFIVVQPNPEERAAAYEIYRQKKLNEHNNIQPTQQDIEKARAEGYVLGADWKTQFTIKAFKGCRRVKDDVKQVAVEYSNGDIQWINKDILKKGEAKDSLKSYLFKLNILNETNRKINKRPRVLK